MIDPRAGGSDEVVVTMRKVRPGVDPARSIC
jgi:hypothetical protein